MLLEDDKQVEPSHLEMEKRDPESRATQQVRYSEAEERKLVRSIDLQ